MSYEKQITCFYCGAEKLSKDEIGLNERIEDFKQQGCVLFG
jgi:hypothetical protein